MASDTPGDAKPSEDQENQGQILASAQEEGKGPPAHQLAEEQLQHPSGEGEDGADEDDEEMPKNKQEESTKSTPKSKKRGRKPAGKSETATPMTDRPARERKVVERYSASPSGRTPGGKSLAIAKGSGTQLKDIPNVAFKLSKQKPDDNMQLLHTILFGKKAKAHSLKRNIGQFSGFVWSDNEEKQRAKVKEKLDRCVKEKLVYFCDVLNIPINKATMKKEELSVKLLDFLESPCLTTDVLLADKEQGQKRKRKSASSKSLDSAKVSAEGTEKKQKKRGKVGEKQKAPSAVEEDAKGDDDLTRPDSGDDSGEDIEKDKVSEEEVAQTESKSEEGTREEADTKGNTLVKYKSKEDKVGESRDTSRPGKRGSLAKSSKSPSTSVKKCSSLKKNDGNAGDTSGSPAALEVSDSKKAERDQRAASKGKFSSKKQSSKSSAMASVKDQGKSKTSKKVKAGPSREEIHEVVVKILKEVDFNTATLSDILKQLGTHFDVDLYSRKAEVKEIIAEVINNMSDEEDEGDEDEEDAKNDDADDADD